MLKTVGMFAAIMLAVASPGPAETSVALDIIHELITPGPSGPASVYQAAGITLWLSRNMLAGS